MWYSCRVPAKNDLPERLHPDGGLDAYESTYMGGAPALFRDKAHVDWRAPTLSVGVAVFVAVWCATHGLGLGLGLGLAVSIALLGLVFTVVRVKVTADFVEVQYGLFGPKIPLAAIESVEAITHEYRSPLRWGISPVARGEWLYSFAGDAGRAVKVIWRNSSGQRRVHYIGSRDHENLAAFDSSGESWLGVAIHQVRASFDGHS